jgi:plasmid stabilization system protein ParE
VISRERTSRTGSSKPHSFRIVWTDRALEDLRTIGDYIARDSPVVADRWVETLMTTVERAARAPFAGRRLPEKGRNDIREVLQRTYRIVYRVGEEQIDVLTIFEGHRLLPGEAIPDHDR